MFRAARWAAGAIVVVAALVVTFSLARADEAEPGQQAQCLREIVLTNELVRAALRASGLRASLYAMAACEAWQGARVVCPEGMLSETALAAGEAAGCRP